MRLRIRVPAPSIKIEVDRAPLAPLAPPALPAKPMKLKRPRRFKVQQRVELTARDRSNKPFLLGEIWRTVSQADKQATAERTLLNLKAETHREYRIAEEWPIGATPRVLK